MSLDTYLNIVHEKVIVEFKSGTLRRGTFVYTQESISIDKTLIKQLY